jgi:hypothetical protein
MSLVMVAAVGLALAWLGPPQEYNRLRRPVELPQRAVSRGGTPGTVRATASQAPLGNAAALFGIGYYGEHIIHIGDGGDEAVRLYGARNVGFKFTVVSLACFHLWTWGGTYCLYEPVFENNRLTDKYKAISKAEAARLLRKEESELTTPFWYRFPPGVLLLPVAFLFGLISALVRRAKKPRPPVDSLEIKGNTRAGGEAAGGHSQ